MTRASSFMMGEKDIYVDCPGNETQAKTNQHEHRNNKIGIQDNDKERDKEKRKRGRERQQDENARMSRETPKARTTTK